MARQSTASSSFVYERGEQKPSVYRDASESFRRRLLPEQVRASTFKPRILVVDDDPIFGKTMQRAAALKGVDLRHVKTLEEVGLVKVEDFDVILMDFALGAVTGLELTRYLEDQVGKQIPTILTSQTPRSVSRRWPSTIREFVHKDLGPFALLEACFEAFDVQLLHRRLREGTH